jgi:hypothetical protein
VSSLHSQKIMALQNLLKVFPEKPQILSYDHCYRKWAKYSFTHSQAGKAYGEVDVWPHKLLTAEVDGSKSGQIHAPFLLTPVR